MVTGWLQDGPNRCYFYEKNGVGVNGNAVRKGQVAIGWAEIGGSLYYFNEYGVMMTGTITVNGKQYTLDKNGVCQP